MNGYAITFLVWSANILLAAVVALIAVLVKMHIDGDKEHKEKLETTLHDIEMRLRELETK